MRVRKGPFEDDPAITFFIFHFFHFLVFRRIKSFFFFLFSYLSFKHISLLASESQSNHRCFLRSPCPQRCGFLRIRGGTAGIGWATYLEESMLQLPRGGGSSSPVKTEPLQIVLLLLWLFRTRAEKRCVCPHHTELQRQ